MVDPGGFHTSSRGSRSPGSTVAGGTSTRNAGWVTGRETQGTGWGSVDSADEVVGRTGVGGDGGGSRGTARPRTGTVEGWTGGRCRRTWSSWSSRSGARGVGDGRSRTDKG